jgi:hypothetical protein
MKTMIRSGKTDARRNRKSSPKQTKQWKRKLRKAWANVAAVGGRLKFTKCFTKLMRVFSSVARALIDIAVLIKLLNHLLNLPLC